MSKYKKGDKFEIEIEQVIEPTATGRNALYRIKGFSALTFDDYGLKLIKHINPEEPEVVDRSKVPIDTPIWVKDFEDGIWRKRHFAKYINGEVYAWTEGRTSWSNEETEETKIKAPASVWKYAKLAEE